MHLEHALSKACQIYLIFFCEIWILAPSVFCTSLRYITQFPALAYILLYEKTKLFTRQIKSLITGFFVSQYPMLFVDNISPQRPYQIKLANYDETKNKHSVTPKQPELSHIN